MIRKLLAWVFVLCMALSCALADDNSDSLQLESKLLTNVDLTAADWYGSEETRALFCAAAAMEVVLLEQQTYSDVLLSALVEGRCYMSKSGLTLVAYYYAEDQVVLVLYQPITDKLEAALVNVSALGHSDTMMQKFQTEGQIDSYYSVDTDDVITMIQMVLDSAN